MVWSWPQQQWYGYPAQPPIYPAPQTYPYAAGYLDPQSYYGYPQGHPQGYPHGYPQARPQARLQSPYTSHRSKFPDINKYLASDTTLLRYNVRKEPDKDINPSYFYHIANKPACVTKNLTKLYLISPQFPLKIEIDTSARPVTCLDVWKGLYDALQEDVEDGEWGIICALDERRKTYITHAAEKRCRGEDVTIKKIDWLGGHTVLIGIEKDEVFAKSRSMPGGGDDDETWIVKFGTP